jgi:hypothetical protein
MPVLPLRGVSVLADRVRIEPDVYARTPTAAARVELLVECARMAPTIEVHAPLTLEGGRAGRLVIDPPRRLAARLRLPFPSAEPGDRIGARGFVHAFFDDEPLALEAGRAGLHVAARRGAWLVLERGPGVPENAASFARELGRAVRAAFAAERSRRAEPPARAVARMRALGRTRVPRGVVGRARLRRAVGWIDAAFPGGPNCFRRVLTELALDSGAAGETLVFGLDVDRTGHVAFKDTEDRSFDVAFEIGP